jgi:uncharacterized OsmC-like protein
MDNTISVEYRRESDDIHVLSTGSPALPEIRIDYTGIPVDQRAGTATRLLCAAALYCQAATLGAALSSRGAKIGSLTGAAVPERGRDERGRSKVSKIALQMQVEVGAADQAVLNKCRLIMRNGCLITNSLESGVATESAIEQIESSE